METLIIENVNFDLLEEQRKTLDKIVGFACEGVTFLRRKDIEALSGISEMLNAWSDDMFYRKQG